MIKTIRKCMALFSKQDGLAQIPLMVALLLMAIAVPAVTKLSQQNQDNRNRAANSSTIATDLPDGCTCVSSKMAGSKCPTVGASCTASAVATPTSGGFCLSGGSCGVGNHCDGFKCVKDVAAGGACNENTDCGPAGKGFCVAGQCKKDGVGDACLGSGDKSCGPGNHCDGFRCVKDTAAGGACNENSDCGAPGVGFCVAGQCKKDGVGDACAGSGDKSCGPGNHCDGFRCVKDTPDGGQCNENSDCGAPGVGFCVAGQCKKDGVGDACAGSGDKSCGVGNHCDGFRCVKDTASGGACNESSDCSDGLVCSGKKCVSSGSGVGDACLGSGDKSCGKGNHCDGFRCVKDVAQGGKCNENSDCGAPGVGFCVAGQCKKDGVGDACLGSGDKSCGVGNHCDGFRCVKDAAQGAKCNENSDCGAPGVGFCVAGSCKKSGIGDACWGSGDLSCGKGNHCDGFRCVKDVVQGGQCNENSDCGAPGVGFCVAGACKKDGVGDACVGSGSKSCGVGNHCDGFRCVKDTPEGGKCNENSDCGEPGKGFCVAGACKKDAVGDACLGSGDLSCGKGNHCDGFRCVKDTPDGGQCNENSDCGAPGVGFCVAGACKKNGVGDACWGSGDRSCGPGNHCDGFRCAKDVPAGGQCNENSDCGAPGVGFCVSGICKKDGVGDACIGSGDRSCGPGNHCDGFRCVRDTPPGGVCNENSDCGAPGVGFCVAGKCSTNNVTPPKTSVTPPKTSVTPPVGCTCVGGRYAGAKCKVVGQSCTGASVTPSVGPNSCKPACTTGWVCLAGADGKPTCAVAGQDSCKPGDVVTQASKGLGCGEATRICSCVSDKNWSCFCDGDGNGAPGCGDNLKGASTKRKDGSTLWLHLDDETSASCLCGDNYCQNRNGKYFCGKANDNGICEKDDGGSGGGGGTGGKCTATSAPPKDICSPTKLSVAPKCVNGQWDYDEQLCNKAGRGQACGGKSYCCPKAGGAWTTDMTKCPNTTVIPTGPTTNPGSCKECAKDFRCYHKGGEYKWFVTGYVMDGFTPVQPGSVEEPCANVPKPSFLGKTKGDANCDGSIDVTDYSLWHKEFFDGDKGSVTKSDWNADFTGSNGKCDGKVDVYDFSLWQKFFSEFKNEN